MVTAFLNLCAPRWRRRGRMIIVIESNLAAVDNHPHLDISEQLRKVALGVCGIDEDISKRPHGLIRVVLRNEPLRARVEHLGLANVSSGDADDSQALIVGSLKNKRIPTPFSRRVIGVRLKTTSCCWLARRDYLKLRPRDGERLLD